MTSTNRTNVCAAWFLFIYTVSLGSLACSGASPSGPSGTASPPDVSGIWNGTSDLTAVTGGECAADLLRAGINPLRRRMTISQAGSSLTITLSSRGLWPPVDETWSGSVDATGRVTATWQPTGGGRSVDYICDPRDANKVRRVVLRSATASLSYRSGSAVIEGTINSRSDVTSLFGQSFTELAETTTERFTKQ